MADIEVPHPGAQAIVGRMLNDALRDHPDVQWLGLVSEDGFAIASDGEGSVDDDAVAAGAVRMMIQVRNVAKALGQPGTSQFFIEGEDNGICVIDKDPWVLLMVGAPGVPIGLLRYEAREIAATFPMGQRPALPEAEPLLVETTDFSAEPDEQVTEPDGEEEIRWADEPTEETSDDVPAYFADLSAPDEQVEPVEVLEFVEPEPIVVEVPEPEPVEAAAPSDFSAWLADPEPAPTEAPAVAVETTTLAGLAPPTGPAIDLPPPSGPAFDLPPPV